MNKVKKIIWYGVIWTGLGLSFPLMLVTNQLYKHNKLDISYKIANGVLAFISRLLFFISRSKITITGLENIPKDETVLFVCNHQAHMDSPILQGFLKKKKAFISIVEYERVPILGTWMKCTGCVFLDRNDVRQSFGTINQAIEKLKSGYSMIVFPEGKMNDGVETFEFQKGWIRLVTKTKVPIVPITLKNTYKIVSHEGDRIGSGHVEWIISKPIETVNLKRENEAKFVENVRNIIIEQL